MTAKTIARDRMLGRQPTPVTLQNIKKVTQFRGEQDLEEMVERFVTLDTTDSAPSSQAQSSESAKMAETQRAAAEKIAADAVPKSVKWPVTEDGVLKQ